MMERATMCSSALALLLVTGCDDGAIDSETEIDQFERDIAGRYIVQMKKGSDPAAIASAIGASPEFVYTHAISGFAGHLSPGQLKKLGAHPDVLRVEADQIVTIVGTQASPSWGL